MWSSLKELLLKLLQTSHVPSAGSALHQPLTNEEKAELTELLGPNAPACSPQEAKFLLYWGLHAQPWPASVASPSTQRIAYLLGRYFDSVYAPPSRLRRLADTWLTWAESSIRSIASAHHTALPPIAAQPSAVPPPERPFGYRRRPRIRYAKTKRRSRTV